MKAVGSTAFKKTGERLYDGGVIAVVKPPQITPLSVAVDGRMRHG